MPCPACACPTSFVTRNALQHVTRLVEQLRPIRRLQLFHESGRGGRALPPGDRMQIDGAIELEGADAQPPESARDRCAAWNNGNAHVVFQQGHQITLGGDLVAVHAREAVARQSNRAELLETRRDHTM